VVKVLLVYCKKSSVTNTLQYIYSPVDEQCFDKPKHTFQSRHKFNLLHFFLKKFLMQLFQIIMPTKVWSMEIFSDNYAYKCP